MYGYGSPDDKPKREEDNFTNDIDKFGTMYAQYKQNPQHIVDTNNALPEIAEQRQVIMKENVPDMMSFTPAKTPKDMPDHLKLIVKATDFDPMSTDSVKNLQARLNDAGYTDGKGNPLKVDGRFGPKTVLAKLKLTRDADRKLNGQPTLDEVQTYNEIKQNANNRRKALDQIMNAVAESNKHKYGL